VAAGIATFLLDTPIGRIAVESSDDGLRRVRLPGEDLPARSAENGSAAESTSAKAASQLREYFAGEREEFAITLDWTGVEATHRRVLETLCELAPFGATVTYRELGQRAGVVDAREVGVMMARNPIPLVVPCHRVVASDGLGGYGGGLELKRRLLELEGVLPPRLDLGDF
jgi:methylated-DNA-[protein]-cysteine S-methyltransferase